MHLDRVRVCISVAMFGAFFPCYAEAQSVAPPSPPTTVAAPSTLVSGSAASTAVRIAVGAFTNVPELATDAALVRAALLAKLRFAFGAGNVVEAEAEAEAGNGALAIRSTLARAFGGYDLALAVLAADGRPPTTEHLRFADPATFVDSTGLVAIVDRAQAPPATLATPIVALFPIDASGALHDSAVAATALLAARLHDATGATVVVLSGAQAADGATIARLGARLSVIGAVARSGSAYDLHLGAYGVDRSQVGDLHVTLRDLAAFPAATVFDAFLTTSLAAVAAPGLASDDVPDVVVTAFASVPELSPAAAVAHAAFVDRLVASGIRVGDSPNGRAATTIAGTLASASGGFALALTGRSAATGASAKDTMMLAAPALVPAAPTVAAFLAAVKTARPAPTHRFVFVPYANPSDKDGYIGFANAQMAKLLDERGYAIALETDLDPVDARLTAPELCKANDADGILLGTHLDHDQVYHKGALRTFGSFLGFLTFGLGNAVVNGLGTIASDDRYVSRANIAATLVDCRGKHLWNKTVQGGNSHYGRNAAAGGSGAISDGISQLVTAMFADALAPTAAAAPAVTATP